MVIVNEPKEWHQERHRPLRSFPSEECFQYQVQQREGAVVQIATEFCSATIQPVLESSSADVPAPDLVARMEALWRDSDTLDDCRYLPDIELETAQERRRANFSSSCMVWPNHGD